MSDVSEDPIFASAPLDPRAALATLEEEAIAATPKSRRWKLRAKTGERKRWYEVPEETEHH